MAWHISVCQWLAQAALVSFLILAAGCLAVQACRQPIRRLRLIELTLAGCLIVPWLTLLPGLPGWTVARLDLPGDSDSLPSPQGEQAAGGGSWPLPELNRSSPQVARTTKTSASDPVTPAVTPPSVPVVSPAASAPEPGVLPSFSISVLLVNIYALAVAVLAGRWLAGVVQLWRLRRDAYPAPPVTAALLEEIAGPAAAGVRLLASDQLDSPLTFRGWRPVILLPGALCRSGDTPALRYCLAHEWSHVERRDVRTWNLAALAQLLFFYQPLFWWLRRQLRLCQDFLADARAAEQAPLAEDYASYLVGLARRRLGVPTLAALGIGDRRSNLYRRILMLVHNREPLERRCPRPWSWGVTLAGLALLGAVAGLRLEAGDKPEPKPAEKKAAKEAKKGETLTYSGKVTEKGTGKPIQGATVTVRRTLYGDPTIQGEKIIQETKHQTDAQGKYTFTIPPDQAAQTYLYIELDVSAPMHASHSNFGYSFAMIRKNEKLGGRPFFEHVELEPGELLTGQIQTPDGKPAAGIKVTAYSKADVSNFREYGSFAYARTDAKGKFQIVIIKGGEAAYWLLPAKYAPSTHVMKKRGDQGLFVLQEGIRLKGKLLDAKGKPLAGLYVNAERQRERSNDEILQRVAGMVRRSAVTNAKGEFELAPLPLGEYRVKPDEHGYEPSSDTRRQPRRPLPAVFLPQKVTLKDGEKPEKLEVRAVPHVIIQAQYVDSKGKPCRGHSPFIFGQIDKQFWFGEARADANGKIVVRVPHGMENVRMDLVTNEHGVLRYRKKAGRPLSNGRQINLGTVTDDVKGIEIVRYVAPIVIVKVVAKDGSKLKDVKVNATSGHYEHQEDGRFRSMQMLPDEDVTITAQAKGYPPATAKVKLPEGATKDVEIVLEKK
jgi:beta-lactamase regulating signal transducer with metallopeptidase domain/uncharacterized GH25 family protein